MPDIKSNKLVIFFQKLDRRFYVIFAAILFLFAIFGDNKMVVFVIFTIFGAAIVYFISFFRLTIDIMPTLFMAILVARFFGPLESVVYIVFAGLIPQFLGGGVFDVGPFISTVSMSIVAVISSFFGFLPFVPMALFFQVVYWGMNFATTSTIVGDPKYSFGVTGATFLALVAYTIGFGPLFSSILSSMLS